MWLAIAAYIASASCLIYCFWQFFRNAQLAGIGICFILTIQIFVRPLMFFTGVDTPTPDAWFGSDTWDIMAYSLLLAGLWIAVLFITYALLRGSLGKSRFLPVMTFQPSLRGVLIVALGLTLLNVACTSFLVLQAGGLSQFVTAVKVSKALKGLYVFREIGVLACVILIYATLVALRPQGARTQSRRIAALTIAMLVVNFGINYAWGNRYNLAVLSAVFVVAYHLYIKRITVVQLIAIGVCMLAMLEGLKELRLFLFSEATGNHATSIADPWTRLSASFHFAQFDAFLLAVRDVGTLFDFRAGQDAINGLLAWVPRYFLEDKQTFQIGGWFRRVYQPGIVNGWPITIVGSWYINFGFIGVILGAMLSGALAAMIDASFPNPRTNPWAATVGAALSVRLLSGGLGFGFLSSYALLVVPLFMAIIAFRILDGSPKRWPGRFDRGMTPRGTPAHPDFAGKNMPRDSH